MDDRYRIYASINGVLGYSSIVLCGAYEVKHSEDPQQPKYFIDLYSYVEVGVIDKVKCKKYIGTVYCDSYNAEETGFYNIAKEQENGLKV